jgi:hypothetical protein
VRITRPSRARTLSFAIEVNSMSYKYLPAFTPVVAAGESCNNTFPAVASYIDAVKLTAVED